MDRTTNAFTLVELLVVITIIVILLSMLAPAMDRAMLAGMMAKCAAQQKAIVSICTTYAAERRKNYPRGNRNSDDWEHTPWVSKEFVAIIEKQTGNNKAPRYQDGTVTMGIVPEVLIDPAYDDFGYRHETYGYVIGYQYLGGRIHLSTWNDGTPPFDRWRTPRSMLNHGDGEMVTCWIHWLQAGGGFSFIAHGPDGTALGVDGPNGAGYHYQGPGSARDPKDFPQMSIGQNIGYADGSVGWKKIDDTKLYSGAAHTGGRSQEWRSRW